MSSKKFFEELYLPALVRAGNYRAIRQATGLMARGKTRAALMRRSPEKRREIASLAGKGRAATITTAERKLMGKWKPGRKMRDPQEHSEAMRKAALARWGNKTPEERRAELNRIRRKRKGAPWPFPHGVKMTNAQAGELGRQAQARKRKLQRFLTRR